MSKASLALLICFSLLPPPAAEASIHFPRRMDKDDRVEALRLVGLGSSTKLLSDPFPLGGYAGFEAGFSIENLPAADLGRLGEGLATPQQDVTLTRLTIGKGLYNNIDLFVQFTPYTRADEISQYGGLVRWGFFQARNLPLSLSILGHANSANIANQLTTRSYGVDMIGGINVDNLALFAGFGVIEATGTFMSGSAQITDSLLTEHEFVSGTHTVIGADVNFSNIFLALQIDRYTLPVFSGKLGLRF